MLSESPPTIIFLPSVVVCSTQESRAGTPRLQGGQKLSQALLHPVGVVLGACEVGKANRFDCLNGRGREEAGYTSGAENQ